MKGKLMNVKKSRLIMEVAEAPYFHVRDSSEFPQVQQGNMRYTNWVVMGPLTIHGLLYNSGSIQVCNFLFWDIAKKIIFVEKFLKEAKLCKNATM